MRVVAVCLLLACAGCARPPAGGPPDPQAGAVVAAAQRLFDAMAARDSTALLALLHPDARIIGVRPDGRTQGGGAVEWVRGVTRGEEALRERMRTPRVEVDGALATLWAPYDFHVGGQFSHCGTDAFQFVREGARWRLLVVTFSVQTEGCPAWPGP